MKCAIMQPTYLPWAGYFRLIAEADVFVFLDDVQFSKRSWQQRNRILLKGQPMWLTVPVQSKGKRDQKLYEVRTDESRDWRGQHLSTIHHAYHRHPWGMEVIDILSRHLSQPIPSLSMLNIDLIQAMSQQLNLNTTFMKSSDIPVSGQKSHYLLQICEYVGADVYLSAAGSKSYIEEEALFSKSNVSVQYQQYTPQPYSQWTVDSFISHLSIVDMVAHIGWQSASQMI